MVIEGITICDYCGRACFPDDFTTVHIEVSGTLFAFSYHNTVGIPCLRKKIEELRQQFAAPTQ